MVAMIGDKIWKKYFQRKYIHDGINTLSRKKEKISQKIFAKISPTSSFYEWIVMIDFHPEKTKKQNKTKILFWRLLETIRSACDRFMWKHLVRVFRDKVCKKFPGKC